MDLTPIFVRIVEGLEANKTSSRRARSKAKKSIGSNNKNPKMCKSALHSKLAELVGSITYMRDYLLSTKQDYLNVFSSILSLASTMTDLERDEIDKDVQDFIKLCFDVIRILKVEAKSRAHLGQIYEHECQSIALAEAYIKTLQEMHIKQKTLRLERNFESQKFFNLSRSFVEGISNGMARAISSESICSSASSSDMPASPKSEKKKTKQDEKKKSSSANTAFYDEDQTVEEINNFKFTPGEAKKLMEEGNMIYTTMNSMNDEVNKIASKLSEISHLQEMFSENVHKQDEDLQRLSSTTIQSTEDIREGNEQLRKAMRNNAGFRVWILFFITTLSFVILFLDWYND